VDAVRVDPGAEAEAAHNRAQSTESQGTEGLDLRIRPLVFVACSGDGRGDGGFCRRWGAETSPKRCGK
jgi:hypothetical protein